MKQIASAALAYFLLVFGTGFVLGVVRTLWLVPRIGVRDAELAEMPVMLAASWAAALWVTRRFALQPSLSTRLGTGVLALTLTVCAELSLTYWLRGFTLSQYLASRDPVSGTAYLVSLAAFAAMPALVRRGSAKA